MEDEQLLEALESAYNRGVTLEQMQGKLSDDAMVVAQDFFSKKKRWYRRFSDRQSFGISIRAFGKRYGISIYSTRL